MKLQYQPTCNSAPECWRCLDNCFSWGKLHLLHVAHLAGRALTHIAGASPSTQQCRQTIVMFLSQAIIEKDMFSKERPSLTSLFWWKCIEKSWVRSFFSIEFRLFSLQGLLGASQELPQFHWYAEQCVSPGGRVTNTHTHKLFPPKFSKYLCHLCHLWRLCDCESGQGARAYDSRLFQQVEELGYVVRPGMFKDSISSMVKWNTSIFNSQSAEVEFLFFFKYFWLGVESVEFYCNCMMASLLQGQSLHFWHLSSLYHDALAARLGIWWVGGFPCPSQQVNNWGLKPLLLSLD